ncbi:sulfotransferase family 2 domain-containing protein [Aliikangiella sp. G2MR2-5]|uniref:sulfotransferase family 2 domain-containing protein n=1 Tax=Aliikangiella sp. G2MR2-5 TaxID=2788943 RepID=UPI0018AA0136|nr:sulfotransferase family 2 domain-containing protein [Aliikangiella sp. G2MR2-5]
MSFLSSKLVGFFNSNVGKEELSVVRARQMEENNVWKRCWKEPFDQTKSIFIHIPKAAGTSISQSLYGENTFHFTADTYNFLPREDFNEYFKFAFVRNPYERILSTYKYSFKQFKEHPKTSVAFVTRFKSFENFVLEWVNRKNISKHYFFYTQERYISDQTGKLLVDYIGKFETVDEDFKFVARKLNIDKELMHTNKSPKRKEETVYTEDMANKVFNVYKNDFMLFGYDKESWKNVGR